MSDEWIGWHFLKEDKCLQYAPHTGVVEGQTLLAIEKPLDLCTYGLHASKRAIDALDYAPGPVVCKVMLAGEIMPGDDKACAQERTCLKMADASDILHEFGCWCAEQALLAERQRGREPDKRSWAAIEAKRKWLRKEISDGELAIAYAEAIAAVHAAATSDVAVAFAYAADAAAAVASTADAASNVDIAVGNASYAADVEASAARRAVYDAADVEAEAHNDADAAATAARADAVDRQNSKLEEMLNELLYGKENANG